MKVHLTQRRLARHRNRPCKDSNAPAKAWPFDTEWPGFDGEIRTPAHKSSRLLCKNTDGQRASMYAAEAAPIIVKGVQVCAVASSRRLGTTEVADPWRCPTLVEFASKCYLPLAKYFKRTWQAEERLLRNHLLPVFGSLRLNEISPTTLQAYQDEALGQGVAQGSVKRRIALLRHLLKLAIQMDLPGVSPHPTFWPDRSVMVGQASNQGQYRNSA